MCVQYYADSASMGTSYVPETGELCAAQFSADNGWYRARVNRIQLDSTFDLTYMDFGNGEERLAVHLRKLAPQFATLPLQVGG